jgi:hypothetical protein
MPGISEKTMIPIGLAASLGLGIISLVRSFDSKSADQSASITVINDRLNRLEARMDKADERWDRVLQELADIKTRLGVVEVKPKQ